MFSLGFVWCFLTTGFYIERFKDGDIKLELYFEEEVRKHQFWEPGMLLTRLPVLHVLDPGFNAQHHQKKKKKKLKFLSPIFVVESKCLEPPS